MLVSLADEGLQPALLRLAEALVRVDDFFDSLGGLPWYQLRCLRFIADAAVQQEADRSHSNGAAAANGLAASSSNGSNGSTSGTVTSAAYGSSSGLITGHGINGTDGGNAHDAHNGAGVSSNGNGCHGSSNGSSVGRTSNGATSSSNGVNGSSGVNGSTSTGNGRCCEGAAAVADGEQTFHMPCGVDMEQNPGAARRAAAQGLQALPYMAEIYPIGGEDLGVLVYQVSKPAQAPNELALLACMHSDVDKLNTDVERRPCHVVQARATAWVSSMRGPGRVCQLLCYPTAAAPYWRAYCEICRC